MGRPREHGESTRIQLIEAAEKQLANGGIAAVSLREAAATVGTTTRAVYTIFGGRRGLVGSLYVRGFQILGAMLDQIPLTKDPAADLVACGVRGFRRFALEHPNLFRLTCERLDPELEPAEEEYREALAAWSRLRERVRRCKDAGLIGNRATADVTWQFHAFAQGLASVELQGWTRDRGDGEAMFKDALRAYVDGLKSPRARSR
jgi:AcrR family transcriptional regulator